VFQELGGIGKTRTVLELTTVVLPSFPDGVWFINLAPITEAMFIGETIASVFGLL
jgi:predicted ATPase